MGLAEHPELNRETSYGLIGHRCVVGLDHLATSPTEPHFTIPLQQESPPSTLKYTAGLESRLSI